MVQLRKWSGLGNCHHSNLVNGVSWDKHEPGYIFDISRNKEIEDIQSEVECFSSANGGGKFHYRNNCKRKHIV